MRIESANAFHLTYCTNIHPGNGWQETFANLRRYVPALKKRFAPRRSFGLGLRLSGKESQELLQDDHLQTFQTFLHQEGLYIFTLNGFPYGPFHGQPVKASVHAPDWREEERVAYTLRLCEILARLLPAGIEGSISTSPLSYKAWVNMQDVAMWRGLLRNIVRVAEELVRIKWQHDRVISLALEPEPDGLLESGAEVVRFYTHWLLEEGVPLLANRLATSRAEAREHLLQHIRVCFDTCHVAVAYEDPATVLSWFAQVGIRVGKVQLSSALKVAFPEDPEERERLAASLRPFAESTYLHQVVQQNHDGSFCRYPDLIDALPVIQDPRIAQWRIHFHVPIFLERFPLFQSTQDTLVHTLHLLAQQQFCHHLEIETYTWSVLPQDLQTSLSDSLAREYSWVLRSFS